MSAAVGRAVDIWEGRAPQREADLQSNSKKQPSSQNEEKVMEGKDYPVISKDGALIAEPSTAELFRVIPNLLSHSQPLSIRTSACDLLSITVRLADLHSMSFSSAGHSKNGDQNGGSGIDSAMMTEEAAAARIVAETHSGAPGSLAPRKGNRDMPLAGIDRALFYKLVTSLTFQSENDADEDLALGGPSDIQYEKSLLPALPSQIRALEALSKEGKEIVGFTPIVPLLSDWLEIAWTEVQSSRSQIKQLSQSTTSSTMSPSPASQKRKDQGRLETLVTLMSLREWNVQAILHLLMSIFKFSFARVELVDVESTLNGVARIILGPERGETETAQLDSHLGRREEGADSSKKSEEEPGAEADDEADEEQAADSDDEEERDARDGAALSSRMESLSSPTSQPRKLPKLKESRALTDGYSYYGLETTSGSDTPPISPVVHPVQPGGEGTSLHQENPIPAPIVLATLPPSSRQQLQSRGRTTKEQSSPSSGTNSTERSPSPTRNGLGSFKIGSASAPVSRATSRQPDPRARRGSLLAIGTESSKEGPFPTPSAPELHEVDVRCVLRLLDATLRYGYMPPQCVDLIVRALCRILGFQSIAMEQEQGNGTNPSVPSPLDGGERNWESEVSPVMSNILRSHCANAALRAVRRLLAEPASFLSSPTATENLEDKIYEHFTDESFVRGSRYEDPSVLVGSVRLLRSAMAYVAELRADKLAAHAAALAQVESSRGASGASAAKKEAMQLEDALAPSLSLPLVLPALRGALKRQDDRLDIEVLELVSEMLPSKPPTANSLASAASPLSAATASALGSSRKPNRKLLAEKLTLGDWDAILELTVLARRHVEGWKLKGGSVGPFGSSQTISRASLNRSVSEIGNKLPQQATQVVKVTSSTPPAAVRALLSFLSNIQLLPIPQQQDEDTSQQQQSQHIPSSSSDAVPWTSKFSALLLSLAPLLPDSLVVNLVQYYKSQHLCLPSNENWISNIRSLLHAFFHRHGDAPKARRELVRLVCGHTHEIVRDLPHHRARLLSEVIVPLARKELENERDEKISEDIRSVLVDGAAACGAQVEQSLAEGEEANADSKPSPLKLARDDEHVFVEIRQLLTRLAKGMDAPTILWLSQNSSAHASAASAHAHGHVSFNVPAGSHDRPEPNSSEFASTHGRRSSATQLLLGAVSAGSTPNPSAQPQFTSASKPNQPSKAVNAVTDLIEIFHRLAFSLPWSLSTSFSQSEKNSPTAKEENEARREKWEKQVRKSCISVFRDMLEILKPPSAAQQPQTNGGSLRARLVALQWLVRLRTDRHHRVYLTGDMDVLVTTSASALLRGPTLEPEGTGSSNLPTGAAMEASGSNDSRARPARPVPSARTAEREREGRAAATPSADGSRSKSRVRDTSREGRAERDRERDRTRSASQNRNERRGGAGYFEATEPLWKLPQQLPFQLPASNLRSDLVFTYMHQEDASCGGHSHALLSSGETPAPLPISEFLLASIEILSIEREWELVSYLICHLPHQLANKHLFCGPKAQIQILALRQVLCSGLLKGLLVPDAGIPDGVKKTDVYAVSYGILKVLISYRTLFSRSEQDELVEAFIAGLNKSQATALPCVRALSVTCYELQKSTTRLLPGMLVRLSTVMSSMTMSVHILELMVAIGHIPSCYANFTESDYKRVFGIALQYIQYLQSPAALTREDPRSSPASFTLSQYVMMLAYYCIALWFMSLRIGDRPKHVPYIARGLLLAHEGSSMGDQTEVIFDFLSRFTYSNAEPKPKRSFVNSVIMGAASTGIARATAAKDHARQSKSWLFGKGLVTVTTLKKEGWVEILVRRASGTTALLCKLENAPVSILPDEDGERVDLPAALMMQRNPDTMASPLHTAPLLPARGEDGEILSTAEDWSPRQHSEHRLRVGEHLRARRPIGPAHFGVARRPRAASFSGGFSQRLNPSFSQPIDAYSQGTPNSIDRHGNDSKAEEKGQKSGESGPPASEDARSEAMREVMRDVLELPGSSGAVGEPEETKDVNSGPAPAASAAVKAAGSATARSGKDVVIDPGFIALQLSAFPDMATDKAPLLLPEEPATDRFIRTLDQAPVVDFHKIGVLYVGPNQTTETEILGNRQGSPVYTQFLSGLGSLVALKGQEDVYTGGLDRQSDDHGKYAYVWGDDITQIVYHTSTLMPSRPEDKNHSAKKALIGNDWTHIVFNESGGEYVFGTIPSQFNFVNIVVSPNSRGGANLGSVAPVDSTFCKCGFCFFQISSI